MNNGKTETQEKAMQVRVVHKTVFSISMLAVVTCTGVFTRQAVAADNQELAKQLSNPVADLISVPMKLDWDTDIGKADADRSTYIVQPVIPIGLNDTWNIISRTIVPVYIDAGSPVKGGDDYSGMGDILQSFFFSPKAPTESGWIWGVGPALSLPTGDDGLTTDKFSVGPTAVALKQADGWTYGALTNQLWSISGDKDAENVSSLYLQPFLSYTTKTATSFTINTESTYNWKTNDWTTPINLMVSQLVRIGKQPVQFLFGYRDYVEAPDNTFDWGLRFQVTFLFPR
jgi:hypothetical protein